MIISYTCKFCRQSRQFEFEPEPGTPELALDKWKAMLACDRCADYHDTRLNCERDARAQANALLICRDSMQVTSARLAEIEARTKQNLTLITKRFARAVCEYLNMPTVWDQDFVEQIMTKPENAVRLLRWYAGNVRNLNV